MTSEQILHAVGKYELLLGSREVVPERADLAYWAPEPTEQLSHCLWMCGQIREILRTPGKEAKAERWLCFIQGVLWASTLGTIDSFRADNTWAPSV